MKSKALCMTPGCTKFKDHRGHCAHNGLRIRGRGVEATSPQPLVVLPVAPRNRFNGL